MRLAYAAAALLLEAETQQATIIVHIHLLYYQKFRFSLWFY